MSQLSFYKSLYERESGRQNNQTASILEQCAEARFVERECNYEIKNFQFSDGIRTTFLTVFNENGTEVACSHGDHSISVVSLKTLKVIRQLQGHKRSPWTMAWTATVDDEGSVLVSGCLAGEVRVWTKQGCILWKECKVPIASLACHPLKPTVAIAAMNSIFLWDLSQYMAPSVVINALSIYRKMRFVTFDNTGQRILTGISIDGVTEDENSPKLYQIDSRPFQKYNDLLEYGLTEQTMFTMEDNQIVVPSCRIHNDPTVAINKDFTMLAVIVPDSALELDCLGVFSVKPNNVGTKLYIVPLTFGCIVSLSFSCSSERIILGYNACGCPAAKIFKFGPEMNEASLNREIKLIESKYFELATLRFSFKNIINQIDSYIKDDQRSFTCVCSARTTVASSADVSIGTNEKCDWFITFLGNVAERIYIYLIPWKIEFLKIQFLLIKYIMAHRFDTCTNNNSIIQLNNNKQLCETVIRDLDTVFVIPKVTLNCLRWAPKIEGGLIAAFNTGKTVSLT